jgi:hypothetical protein
LEEGSTHISSGHESIHDDGKTAPSRPYHHSNFPLNQDHQIADEDKTSVSIISNLDRKDRITSAQSKNGFHYDHMRSGNPNLDVQKSFDDHDRDAVDQQD